MTHSPLVPLGYKKNFLFRQPEVYPTMILRHRKENLKKCSLRGLETRDDFRFVTYPCATWPDFSGYCLLTLNAPILSKEDAMFGLFLLDGTWKYAANMEKNLPRDTPLVKRSLPSIFHTAYPRYQTSCLDPKRGLASIEALYLAFQLTGRNTEGLLDHYYWKEQFLTQLKKEIQC